MGMLTSTSVVNAQKKQGQLKTTSTSKVEEEPIEVINRWFSRFKTGASAEECWQYRHL